jgi:hypothetical protein
MRSFSGIGPVFAHRFEANKEPVMFVLPMKRFAAAVTASMLVLAPFSAALAGGGGGGGYGGGGGGHGPGCHGGGGGGKIINIYKPVNIYKPINISKNININKNINLSKNININKNVNINKNININKSIVINKGGSGAEAAAFAAAFSSANASASAGSQAVASSGSYSDVTVINQGGGLGTAIAVSAEAQQCEMQEATIVKSIHAICVAEGREFAASHMLRDTWIESGFEGEVARCIPGAHLKIVVGDVVQSDQGMAGTYAHGSIMECGEHEALVHFKDGQLKCVAARPVPDCTERTNLRKYGTGDFFFSYRGKVCVGASRVASAEQETSSAGGLELSGGVGPSDNN